ncbi:hypothetical protein BU15DRAFT_63681 [Melanogaster broomeanus]|nr:hypothetical protein BU15DRAFT_63681 [Melanogaster broomeanus]
MLTASRLSEIRVPVASGPHDQARTLVDNVPPCRVVRVIVGLPPNSNTAEADVLDILGGERISHLPDPHIRVKPRQQKRNAGVHRADRGGRTHRKYPDPSTHPRTDVITLVTKNALCYHLIPSGTSELEGSIRSTYVWYWRSTLCMMHLPDILPLGDLPNDISQVKCAFYPFQTEIMQDCIDVGILAWLGTPSRYNAVIAVDPECYSPPKTDPDDALARLLYVIGREEQVQMSLSGLARLEEIPLRVDQSRDTDAIRMDDMHPSSAGHATALDSSSAIAVAREWNELKLAIIDYEIADTDPHSDDCLQKTAPTP